MTDEAAVSGDLDREPKRGRGEMTIIEHLEELRRRLFKVVIAFVISSVAAWLLYDSILSVLVQPLKDLPETDRILSGGKLVFQAPQEPFFVRLKVTAYVGFVLALPVTLWQLWRFVTPGLYAREKRFAILFVIGSVVLFAGGVLFAFALLPQALTILFSFAGTEAVILPRASEYLSFVLLLALAFGLTFEMPVVLLALALAGVITSRTLRRGRRIAWVAITILAAVVTPTQDPYTLVVMALPLVLLYEVTVLVARLLKR